jgi:hypothetical protein
MEKMHILPNEPNHYYFYQLGHHCDPGAATTGFTACGEPLGHKSSQVPFHEPFTNQMGLFQSRSIKANQGYSR